MKISFHLKVSEASFLSHDVSKISERGNCFSHQNFNFNILFCGILVWIYHFLIVVFRWYFGTVMNYLMKSSFSCNSHLEQFLRFWSIQIFCRVLKIVILKNATNGIQNVLTHIQMRLYLPVIRKCNKIFMLDHTYLCTYFNFYFYLSSGETPCIILYFSNA